MRLLITCPYGFVSTLNQELKHLRFQPIDSFDTGTYVETDLDGMMTINLRSRVASKVYLQVGPAVSCETFDQLFQITQTLDRTQRLPASEYLELQAYSFQSTLMSEKSIQSIVHKAILNQLMQEARALNHPTTLPYEIMVQIINNKVTFFLNTSGPGLHKRGYRKEQGSAPLKENVAAGLVLMSGRRRQQRLRDPCCGSGTICIEAAMIARNIAPGLHRTFAFERFAQHDTHAWEELRTSAQQKAYPDKSFQIFGSDSDLEMIEKARTNAQLAGVGDTITFLEHDLLQGAPELLTPLDQSPTCLVTNPPYGKRLAPEGLKDLYRALLRLSNAESTHITCITSYEEFSHLLTSRRPRKDVKNGADEVHVWMKPRG